MRFSGALAVWGVSVGDRSRVHMQQTGCVAIFNEYLIHVMAEIQPLHPPCGAVGHPMISIYNSRLIRIWAFSYSVTSMRRALLLFETMPRTIVLYIINKP